MLSRRTFMRSGFGAVAVGLCNRKALPQSLSVAQPNRKALGQSIRHSISGIAPFSPYKSKVFRSVPLNPASVVVDGLPFAEWFTGDTFANNEIPFHSCANCFADGSPPMPTEERDIVVAGGGISGLATAYLLRHHKPVLLEMYDHFGGSARGEVWAGTPYSLGNAYIITPDAGSFLEGFYRELGLNQAVREQSGDDIIELNGQLLSDFWEGQGFELDELPALERYAEIVNQMAEVDYPEIPLPEGKDNSWILDLDNLSLKQHIQQQMNMPIPPLLEAAIQGYCYSSFAAGWQHISAASGWNFLAAEEYGRWVFPGATAYMADAMWRRLRRLDETTFSGARSQHVRTRSMVVDVRLTSGNRVQVTYLDRTTGSYRSILAKRVVMCMPKHVAKYIVEDLESLDSDKRLSMNQVQTHSYVVANVLINAPVREDFYDVFLLNDGNFPIIGDNVPSYLVTDMLSGHYALPGQPARSVLTLYAPFPNLDGLFMLIQKDVWNSVATALAPQIRRMLGLLGLVDSDVAQVRMTRFGHAVPVARPGFIAEGHPERLIRPVDERIYFVNQDNWALPAVENCLLDAQAIVPQIVKNL